MPSCSAASTFLGLGRHLGPTAAVKDRDRRGARSERRPGRVHGRAAAADNDDRARQNGLLAEVDPLEEERGRDDARQAVAGHAELAAAKMRPWPGRWRCTSPPDRPG